VPFGQVRVTAEQRVGDDQAKNGVAEELKALIGGQATVFVGEGAMREGTLKQPRGQAGVEDP